MSTTIKKISGIFFALVFALAMSVMLTGCGGGSSDSADNSSESTEAASTETSTDSSAASTDSSSSSANGVSIDVSDMTGYMGVSDKGETFYYAESSDHT